MIPHGTPTARSSARCAACASAIGSIGKSATAQSAVPIATSSAADDDSPAPTGSVEVTSPAKPVSTPSSVATASTNAPKRSSASSE